MLRVIFGEPENKENFVYATSIYFNNQYEEEWFEDEFTLDMLKDVDKSEVIMPGVIRGVIGNIPYEKISGGLKTLLLINNVSSKLFNASKCGDNCSKWLIEIAKRHEEQNLGDVTIVLYHAMKFTEPFNIYIVNNGKIVDNMSDFAYYQYQFCHGDEKI